MLTTTPTQQSPATTALPPPAANESFCTWLCGRIKDIFQKILSWLCCSSSRNEATTPMATPDATPHHPPITNRRRTAPPVSPTISDPEPTPTPNYQPLPPLFTTVPIVPDLSTAPTPSNSAPAATPTVSALPVPTPNTTPAITTVTDWSEVEPYIQSPERLATLPQAECGSQIYFTNRFVIKHCVQRSTQDRFNRTETARALCARERYQCIVVPEARLFGDFIVEQRLPLNMRDMKEQIGLYITHRNAFTQTARDFAAMLCKASNYDLIGGNQDAYAHMVEGSFPRYDNATLYLEGGEGRIGMVDLEHFGIRVEVRPSIPSKWFDACTTAICFFPLHFDEILATILQAGGTLSSDERTELTRLRDKMLQRFDTVYNAHANLLRIRNITPDNPRVVPQISPARKAAIVQALLTTSSMARHPALQPLLPEIVDIAIGMLTRIIGEIDPPSTTLPHNLRLVKLASSRSFLFGFDLNSDDESAFAITVKAIKARFAQLQPRTRISFAKDLLQDIFQELARGGEILYFGVHCSKYILFC